MVTRRLRDTNTNAFFDRLGVKVRKIAEKAEADMAQQMVTSLRHRTPSKHGQYPKWERNPSNPKEPKRNSNHSHRAWYKQKTARGWSIRNSATNPTDGYNYPYNLMTGKKWSRKVRAAIVEGGGKTKRLVSSGNKIFSEQMPNGISPWLRDRKREMKKNIQRQLK